MDCWDLQRNCYPNLVNCFFEGIYQLTIMPDGGFIMEITLAFPYNLDNWYNKEITNFDPVCGEYFGSGRCDVIMQ